MPFTTSLLTYKSHVPIKHISSLGYMHPGGKLIFKDQNTAIEYARKRVVKALNADKPFERSLVIEGNAVLKEFGGKKDHVYLKIQDIIKNIKEFITVHGHPDILKSNSVDKGITYPISLQDLYGMLLQPKEIRSIVYNSKGEYSMVSKTKSGFSLNEPELDEIINEYNITVGQDGLLGMIFKKFRTVCRLVFSKNNADRKAVNEIRQRIFDVDEFLSFISQKYNLEYKTNYSCLKK